MSDPVEDFRRRTARIRRERTARRLVEALFAYGDTDDVLGASIDDVRTVAGVARGSFYRHFPTVDALLDHVGAAVAAQVNAEMSARFDAVADPALRMGQHLRYLVRRATVDAVCAQLLLRRLARDGAVSAFAAEHALGDFEQAVGIGRFSVPSTQVAADLGHGMMTAMLRRAVLDGYDEARLQDQVMVLLRAFGLDEGEARETASAPLPPDPGRPCLRERVLALCSEAQPAAAGSARSTA